MCDGPTSNVKDADFFDTAKMPRNLPVAKLVEIALMRGEGTLTSRGALSVRTGKYTGRSPNDKFIVDDKETSGDIWWGELNKPMSPENFQNLFDRLAAYLRDREIFLFDGYACADPRYQYPIRFINELAWQNIFVQNLFLKMEPVQLQGFQPRLTVISAPRFRADPHFDKTNSEAFIAINFSRGLILIGGTHYAGEIKKSVFSALNYLLPLRNDVLSMHCSANTGKRGDVALFFGLSGTGKTTLSTDPERFLIGDDEHGWSEEGIFNLEGGSYAKCINLSREHEPLIWEAIRFGCVMENVIIDSTSAEPDFGDGSITENTRAGYPIEYIDGAIIPGVAGHPRDIIFLTADAFGVMPPVAKLTGEQIIYHFLQGYTSKLAGTERGITEPVATFSTCFGAPFLPLRPRVYARMLEEKVARHGTSVYLVNTGWSGGPYGIGNRIKLKHTRAIINAIVSGQLDGVSYDHDPLFNLSIPRECPGIPQEMLHAENTWRDGEAFRKQAEYLAGLFGNNYANLKL
ncbi:MAG TPA: phosphoenolpyruvate carboxykinase (ATP) [Firmicutes bacterium]|nr:phosphoenolpyruvate carboxykinase (ATP) [Bacillota bacterium]